MIKRELDLMPLFKTTFLFGLFYIAWNAFFRHSTFYSTDNSFQAMFTNYDSLNQVTPFFLLIFRRFFDYLRNNQLMSPFIIGTHFLACSLFYLLFDRKKDWPWASVFFIFSPFVFYDLSIQDFRHGITEIFGVMYLWLLYKEESLRLKNVYLLLILIIGVFFDFSFLLFPMVELFLPSKSRASYFRLLLPLILSIVLYRYDRMIMQSLSALPELVYAPSQISIVDRLVHFFNSWIEFWLGLGGFGHQLMERDVIVRELFYKLALIIALFYGAKDFIKTKGPWLIVWILVTIFFVHSFQSQRTVFALLGTYANFNAIKASLFSSLFMVIAANLNFKDEKKWLSFGLLSLALFSWLNIINNSSLNNSNIHRIDAPVFWGVLKNNEIKFSKKFSDIYSDEIKVLPFPDRLFANGLKEIKSLDYDEYKQKRTSPNTLLDVFVKSDLGEYLEAQEALGRLFLEKKISNDGFKTVERVINTSYANRLQSGIVPILYELLRNKDSMDVAESLYLLSLVQFAETGNSGLIKVLLNEFGSVFKSKK